MQQLLVFADLRAMGITLARPTINRMAKQGRFPAPIKFTARHHAWTEESIQHWLECRVKGVPYSNGNGQDHEQEKLVDGAWQPLPPDAPANSSAKPRIARRSLPPEPAAPKRTRRPLLKGVPLF